MRPARAGRDRPRLPRPNSLGHGSTASRHQPRPWLDCSAPTASVMARLPRANCLNPDLIRNPDPPPSVPAHSWDRCVVFSACALNDTLTTWTKYCSRRTCSAKTECSTTRCIRTTTILSRALRCGSKGARKLLSKDAVYLHAALAFTEGCTASAIIC